MLLLETVKNLIFWIVTRVSTRDYTVDIFSRSGFMLGIGCALTYHTGVQKLNRIVANKKNATYNGLSLTGNSLGAIIVFWGISHLLKTSPFEESLMTMTWCTLALSMIFTLIYLIPQRYINHHECKSVSDFLRWGFYHWDYLTNFWHNNWPFMIDVVENC